MTIKVFTAHNAYVVSVDRVPVAMFTRLPEARSAAMERAIMARNKGESVTLEEVIG